MKAERKIILLIPLYNEGGKIGRLIKKVPRDVVREVLAIDDGSMDNTYGEISREHVTILRHEKRRGIGAAIRTGIAYARENGYDIIAVMAGNGKDDPQDIRKLVGPIIQEDYDYIQGSRYIRGGVRNKMPLHRLFFTKGYSILISLVSGKKITDATNGFRAYKVSLFKDPRIDIQASWLDESLEYYLGLKVMRLGYRVKEVPVKKIYPEGVPYKQYTKIKPVSGWFKRLKPLIYLTLGIMR